MDNTITINIQTKGGQEFEGIEITKDLKIASRAISAASPAVLIATLQELFSRGVYRMEHVPRLSSKGGEERVWLRVPVAKNSLMFFETVIEMLEQAGYTVSLSETKERKVLVEKIKKLLASSTIETAYKKFLKRRLPALTDQQLKKIIQTLQEEPREYLTHKKDI